MPPANAWPLDICKDHDLPLGKTLTQIENWWGFWFEHNKLEVAERMRDQFKAAWVASAEYQQLQSGHQQELERREAAEAKRQKEWNARMQAAADQQAVREQEEAEHQRTQARERRRKELLQAEQEANARRAKFDLTVKGLSNDELCAAFHERGYDSAKSELLNRNALPAAEWTLVAEHRVAIGMSETALLCSWGRARVNRTVTAAGEHEQYVYASGTYVYVVNGRVTAYQDER